MTTEEMQNVLQKAEAIAYEQYRTKREHYGVSNGDTRIAFMAWDAIRATMERLKIEELPF